MKEYDYQLKDIFSGLVAERVIRKDKISFLECHNIEPLGNDYDLHEFVIDMDTDAYGWGNS